MKYLILISSALCCVSLSGCVVPHHHHPSPPGVKVMVPAPAVVVPVPVVVDGGAAHCPPGQAKKGRC